MKTRVIAMIMVMILVLSGIAGCGSKDAESATKQDTTEARDGGDNSDDPQDEDMKALETLWILMREFCSLMKPMTLNHRFYTVL